MKSNNTFGLTPTTSTLAKISVTGIGLKVIPISTALQYQLH